MKGRKVKGRKVEGRKEEGRKVKGRRVERRWRGGRGITSSNLVGVRRILATSSATFPCPIIATTSPDKSGFSCKE